MTIEVGSERDARKETGAVISARAAGPARKPRAASPQHGAVRLGIGLATPVPPLQSRRLHKKVIIGVIGLGALAGLARETRPAPSRLAAWDKVRRLS